MKLMSAENKRRGSFILRGVLLIFAVAMVFYLSSLIKQYTSLQDEHDKVSAIRDEKALLLKEKTKLLETGDDAAFIERAAREKLGFVYPDEHIYIDISGD